MEKKLIKLIFRCKNVINFFSTETPKYVDEINLAIKVKIK